MSFIVEEFEILGGWTEEVDVFRIRQGQGEYLYRFGLYAVDSVSARNEGLPVMSWLPV